MKHFALLVGLTMSVAACSESSPADVIDVEPSFAKAASRAVVNSARGSGNVRDTPGRVVTFNAKEHADGSVSGKFQLQFPANDFDWAVLRADVTCLAVNGNVAIIGGTTDNETFPGDAVFMVEDNGEGNNDDPDRMSLMWVGAAPGFAQSVCDRINPTPFPLEVSRGNVQVN